MRFFISLSTQLSRFVGFFTSLVTGRISPCLVYIEDMASSSDTSDGHSDTTFEVLWDTRASARLNGDTFTSMCIYTLSAYVSGNGQVCQFA